MATDKRTYPNTYFAWYNDDKRVAILTEDTTATSGERTKERYDTYQGSDVTGGLRKTDHSKYEVISDKPSDLSTAIGLDTGLQPYLIHYVKSRLYEDAGDFERAKYHRNMYEIGIKQYATR